MEKKRPIVCVYVLGGVVQDVITSIDIDVVVIDYDEETCEGADTHKKREFFSSHIDREYIEKTLKGEEEIQ